MNQPAGGWQPPQNGQAFGQPAQPPAQPQQQQQQGPPTQGQMPQQGYPQQQMPMGQQPSGMPVPGQQMSMGQQPPGMPVPGQQTPPGYGMGGGMGDNPFAGMTSGDQSGGARYPFLGGGGKNAPNLNGSYRIKIAGLKYKPSRAGKKNYIIEAEIVEGNQPERPQGMVCSIFIDIGNQDTGFQHLAAFFAALHGYDPTTLPKNSDVTPWDGQNWMTIAQNSVAEHQPFTGWEIGCHVNQIQLKNGGPWTLHTWAPRDSVVIPPTPPPLVIPFVQEAEPQQQGGGGAPPGWGPQTAPQQQMPQQGYSQQQQQMPQQGYPQQQMPQQQMPQQQPQQGGPPAPYTPPGAWGGPTQ